MDNQNIRDRAKLVARSVIGQFDTIGHRATTHDLERLYDIAVDRITIALVDEHSIVKVAADELKTKLQEEERDARV